MTNIYQPTILIIATLDTKEQEAGFLKRLIQAQGCNTLLMDAGILSPSGHKADVSRDQVAEAGGIPIKRLLAYGDKGKCIQTMMKGVQSWSKKLFAENKFQWVISIGGAQGTDLGTAGMRVLPFGIPKFMVSTVASGLATFGPYVGTKDIIMMHSVADLQGLNILTKKIMENAASAICGMVKNLKSKKISGLKKIPAAVSMLGTTTPGALMAKDILEKNGFECVAFHQNGTGGIAMEDMISEGVFKGVLDLNLHELGDYVAGGLHGSIRDYRLDTAGKMGLLQVIDPGSSNNTGQGPYEKLPDEMKRRKYIIHNPNLTLVRLSHEELRKTARLTAEKLNRAKGPVHVFIPLKGFSYPDREGLPHWEPEGNHVFIDTLKENLDPSIPLEELNAHINDEEFIDPVVQIFLSLMNS